MLLDHLVEADRVLAGVVPMRRARHEPVIGPLPGRGIGHGRDIGGDLRRLPGDDPRAEYDRETTIDVDVRPVIERQAENHREAGRDCGAKAMAGGWRSRIAQLWGHGGEDPRAKLGWCPSGYHPPKPSFDLVVHCDSSIIRLRNDSRADRYRVATVPWGRPVTSLISRKVRSA